MQSFRKELWFNTNTRRAFINITHQVESCIHESGIREGLVLVNAMHITASVFINDDESGLHHDFEVWLEKLVPEKPGIDQDQSKCYRWESESPERKSTYDYLQPTSNHQKSTSYSQESEDAGFDCQESAGHSENGEKIVEFPIVDTRSRSLQRTPGSH